MADLLPGSSDSIVAENIRTLKSQGYSEAEAVSRANSHASSADDYDETDDTEPANVEPEVAGSPSRQFVVVTKDYSGLGWAKKLMEEGETVTIAVQNPEDKPEHIKQFEQVAKGFIPTMKLSEALHKLRTDDTYWIFAENNFSEEADRLKKAGQKVFGTSALSEKMEHDRQYAVDVVSKAGLDCPYTYECSTKEEGLSFLDENPDTAYVFKPDDGKFNHLTFVPVRDQDADANRETYAYIAHMNQEPGNYILQERVEGTEINVEVWMYEGEPFFAYSNLEAKRKNVGDLGEMAGCAGDFGWVTPLDSPLIQDTVGRLFDFYKQEKYTGFADANIIYTEKGPMFLEVCNRFGYNAHVTLFLALAVDSVGDILADFVDGHVSDMVSRFRPEIGTSLTLFLDHPREGLPLHVDERWEHMFYPMDGYKEDGQLLLAGYSNEVGIFTSRGMTLEEAALDIVDKLRREAVSYPGMYYRTDLGKRDFPNSPMGRYDALNDQWGHSMRVVGGGAHR